MITSLRPAVVAAVVVLGVGLLASTATAHTEATAVAVPAGAEATVAFAPTHGCGESPTVAVSVRAPVPDARAEAIEGWTATATPDGAGNTVLEWTGGPLPIDETGSFPVEFVVPDAVGTLLAFPAVQRCESGAELAWIGTAPGDEYPAPQVLVLAAGSEPAATLDDVPADAPGRDQLAAVLSGVDPDADAAAPPPTAAPTVAPTTAAPASTTTPPTAAPTAAAAAPTTAATVPATVAPTTVRTPTTGAEDGGGGAVGWVIAVVVAVAVAIGAAVLIARRRAS